MCGAEHRLQLASRAALLTATDGSDGPMCNVCKFERTSLHCAFVESLGRTADDDDHKTAYTRLGCTTAACRRRCRLVVCAPPRLVFLLKRMCVCVHARVCMRSTIRMVSTYTRKDLGMRAHKVCETLSYTQTQRWDLLTRNKRTTSCTYEDRI